MSREAEPDPIHRPDGREPDEPLPRLPHLLSMRWLDGAFLHWPFDPTDVRPHVPDRFELQTYDGDAWVSVVPFVLARAGLRGSPSVARWTGPELNLRTYVTADGHPGLYFFSIDLDSAPVASLGRLATGVPCFSARQRVDSTDSRVRFSSERVGEGTRFAATYRPTGAAARAKPGSLDHWLVERRRFFSIHRAGVVTAEIAHEPWPLRPASVEIEENELFEAAGLPEPTGDPRCHFCGTLDITGSIVRRLNGR